MHESRRVIAHIPNNIIGQIDEIAYRDGSNRSEVIRRAIIDWLDKDRRRQSRNIRLVSDNTTGGDQCS